MLDVFLITDKFKVVSRPVDKPFRLCVGDIFKGMGSGFSVTGRIVSGSVQTGDKLLVLPCGDIVSVKSKIITLLNHIMSKSVDSKFQLN